MYKINWEAFLQSNVMAPLRKAKRLAWLRVILSPIRRMWDAFTAYRKESLYRVNHTGQVIYLQKALNDAFDPVQRRIEVVDGDFETMVNLYRRIEQQPLYIYWRWGNQQYQAGERVLHLEKVWEAQVQTSAEPSKSTDWKEIGDNPMIQFREEYFSGASFVVLVPVILTYDSNRMKSIIDFYRVAGRSYSIKTK